MICFFTVHAQTVIIGTVKNDKNEPLYVTITLQRLGSDTILGYASTDDKGRYEITYNGIGDSLAITVRGMTVEQTMRNIANHSSTVDFVLKETVNQLREVRVSANSVRRRGDTLNYAVSVFKGQNDRTIEDVMRKLPGIEVSSSGAISYNGKSINKFYIENLDMLDGRYNVATRNIKAEDIASVQVYENHQPIKAETIFSDQAAINLKLKDRAKGIWTINALAGAGYKPFLWNGELSIMHFAINRQHISMYKGNNSGHTADEELLKHYDAGGLPNFGGILSVSEPSMPNVDKKRYTDNRTYSISINQLVKIKETELTANINYYNEHLDKKGYAFSTQYMPGGKNPLLIEETMANSSRENNLDVSLRLQKNKSAQYLRNSFDIKSSWNKVSTGITTISNSYAGINIIGQHLNRPYFTIGNTLNMMQRIESHAFRINFNIGFNYRPHELQIRPAYYFGSDSLQSLNQEVVQKNINATLHTSYGKSFGDFNLDFAPRFEMNLCNLTSELTRINRDKIFIPATDSLRNNLWYNTYQIGIEQNYTYSKSNRVKIRLMIPTYFYIIVNDDHGKNQSVSRKRWIVNPSLKAEYRFSPSFKMLADGHYRKSYGNFNDSYKGYILQSYRNLLRNTSDRLVEYNSCGGSFNLEFRNAVNMLFINAGCSYKHNHKNLLYGYNYDGILGMKTTLDRSTNADFYSSNVNISKAFSLWRTKIEAFGQLNNGKSELLLQDILQPYYMQSYSAGYSINTTPCRLFNLTYQFSWIQNQQWAVGKKADSSVLRTQSHIGKIWIFPTDRISMCFNIDYLHYNKGGNPNMAFADALIRYCFRQTELELECSNLFNTKRYVSTLYSEMGRYINRYELRPLSFLLKIRFNIR